MLELLLLVSFVGFLLASNRLIGFANPFQIYFFIWFLVFFCYYLSKDSFISVSSEFLLLIFTAMLFPLLFLISIYTINCEELNKNNVVSVGYINERLVLLAQVSVFFAAPLAYHQAINISGGENIFSVVGYILLRSAMTDDGKGYGLLAYFSILSGVVSSISSILYMKNKVGFTRLVVSILVSLFYCYLATGRTFVLLFMCLLFVPLIVLRIISVKGVFICFALLISLFVFISIMTAKGLSTEAGFVENIDSLSENLRSYTVAPFLALSQLVNSYSDVSLGENTFRVFFLMLYKLGITNEAPISLIRDYTFVPDATNVYTVYEAYFRDYSYLGFFIPPVFLILHWKLYQNARTSGGVCVFYYAASVYPLLMQFFQDQYFSLLSQWMQIGFWYWLFLVPKNNIFINGVYHD